MLTDAPPRDGHWEGFLKSDGLKTLDLPENGSLPHIAKSIEAAMKTGKTPNVRVACAEFLAEVSQFYSVPPCGVRVLAARPLRVREHWATELFGDYHPETMAIRLWMRTAIRKEVTSFGTFLSTLCHEFCHHLDFHLFSLPIHGTREGSTNAPPLCTITRKGLPARNCSGLRCPAGAGGLTGRGEAEAVTIDHAL